MTLGLSLRFWLAKWFFNMAQRMAAGLLHAPKLPAWAGPMALPGARDRRPEIEATRGAYALVPTSAHFGISVDLGHDTLRELPAAEAYPPKLTASKAFLKVGFGIDVSSDARWANFEEILAVYGRLGVPAVAARWRSDEEFVRQRLQGPNPTWIARVTSAEARSTLALPEMGVGDGDEVYAADFRPVMEGAFGAEGRFCYPCVAVFTVEGGKLTARGIRLERADGSYSVSTPADGPAWMLAKMFYQNADIWVHEVVTHYLWCHVYLEKVILATHRNLAAAHPLRRLFALHFEHTLNLNRNGLMQLVGDGGYFDAKFSPGGPGKAAAVAFGNREWAFWRQVLPDNVARRDVGDLPDYPWRDDATLVWAELSRLARDFVGDWYADDGAVLADGEVRAWSAELSSILGDRGFPAIDGVEALRLVVTATLFQVVQHDLVNAPQFHWYGFPPSSPPIMTLPFPADKASVTERTLVDALPNVGITLNAILATYGFSTRYNAWGDHAERYLSDSSLERYRAFLQRLRDVETELQRRNALREVPYTVSLPSQLSLSISA